MTLSPKFSFISCVPRSAVNLLEELMNIPNRTLCLTVASSLLLAMGMTVAGAAQDDSLAAQARQVRKNKATTQTRTFDNDNLPREDKLSIVGTPQPAADANPPAAATVTTTTTDASSKDKSANVSDNNVSAKDAAAKKQAEWSQWKDRIVAQKDAIDLSQRELDVTEREYKLRMAAMYADVGNRLRNSGQWDKEDADYKAQIEAKRKAVVDNKQKLEDMQEEARKAGVPASIREP
jgi:hypothetical protein